MADTGQPVEPELPAKPPHVPDLLREVIDGLCIKDGGVFIDGTLGAGGHF